MPLWSVWDVEAAGSNPITPIRQQPRDAVCVWGFFIYLNKTLAPMPASFLAPVYTVTLNPRFVLGSALFFVLSSACMVSLFCRVCLQFRPEYNLNPGLFLFYNADILVVKGFYLFTEDTLTYKLCLNFYNEFAKLYFYFSSINRIGMLFVF